MHLVSISRRTDIAAFYTPWLLARLDAGFCHTFHPFGSAVYRISLRPEDCLGLVFWTRYPQPVLPHLRALETRGYRFYFHVTVTGYGAPIETHNPPLARAVQAFRSLADTISPARVIWRYDPIVLSGATDEAYHLRQFETLTRELEGFTGRCYFSFLDHYGKTRRNLARIDTGGIFEPEASSRLELARRLAEIASSRGIALHACCEDSVLGGLVHKGHCVDTELLGVDHRPPAAPTREECGCVRSHDIGAYDTCRFGCVYCYATNSREAAVRRADTLSVADTALWRPSTLAGRDLDEIAVARP